MISAIEIAQALASNGGKLILPTDEQRAIIESTHMGPTVIIAGAGSGKTETLSQRVLWLVANGIISPQEILGLTFTRKAAGELSQRIRKRLKQLRKAGLIPQSAEGNIAPDITVDVSTYHSYAGRILVEHGIRIGIDADIEPLGEAAAWQLTNQVVNSFAEVDYGIFHKPAHIVEAVLNLSSEIAEHNQSVESIRAGLIEHLEDFQKITSGSNDETRSAIEIMKERLAILPMIEKIDQHRLEHGDLTFNDQMSYAAKLVEQVPEISEIERAKYKVVLLDEYQDTSYSQVRFLSSLFGRGHAVTAVGDPNQAIYGWRGASTQTLETFAEHFGKDCKTFDLLTTWRNDKRILEFANTVIGSSSESVKPLLSRLTAGEGEVSCGLYLTLADEAEAIAKYMANLWHDPKRLELPEDARSSFAVLVRTKSYIPQIEMALQNAGLPTEVVGVGGLVHIPEIADIIALLRTVTFPDAGTALARLLIGPRLALGPKDLAALGSYSRDIAKKSQVRRSDKLEEILEFGNHIVLEADDFAIGSIIEALEFIDDAPRGSFSSEGLNRLKQFKEGLTGLRRNMTGSITDMIIEAERFLHLDTEVLVRDGWEKGRRHLDKFLDEAATFQRAGGSLSTFLQWLDAAEAREGGLKPASITVNNRAVQLLTVHSAKGAEWDVVAVPGLIEGVFPGKERSSSAWTKYSGSLPLQFRGDHLQFEDFQFPHSNNIKASDVGKALEKFSRHWQERKIQEEFRLGYVAFTRAKTHLLCTATWFRDGKRAVEASALFNLAYEFCEKKDPSSVINRAEKADENPDLANPRSADWPLPNSRAGLIQESAKKVVSAQGFDIQAALGVEKDPQRVSLLSDAQSLISQVKERNSVESIYLPQRLSVSSLITLEKNPEELAINIRRPMPRHTDPFAKRGTEFHLWLERHFESSTLFDEDVFDPMVKSDVPLKELQDCWLASSWAKRTPHEVEAGFETVIAGVVLRGRIDAVYKDGDEYEVVDWKTGRVKEGEDLESASIQLAMYRLAYAKLHNIPIEKIKAAFYYVADDKTIYRENLSGEDEIAAIISAIELVS